MIAVIHDGINYQIGDLIKQDKKSIQIKLYENLIAPSPQKNISQVKISRLVYICSLLSPADRIKIQQLISTIDIKLLWEISQDSVHWTLTQLYDVYFGNNDNDSINTISLLLSIFTTEVYFIFQTPQQPDHNNLAKNPSFKRSNEQEVLQKSYQKQQREEQYIYINTIYNNLINYQQPSWNIDPINDLLHNPKKNLLEYKAFSKAVKDLKIKPLDLLLKLGYITSIDDYLVKQFYNQYYQATVNKKWDLSFKNIDHLEYNPEVIAFSIDDSNTGEIDDALSVQYLPNNHYLVGVHIAAACLCPQAMAIANELISSVYFPGSKLTMLPPKVVDQYSLQENKIMPTVSIYFEIDEDLEILQYHTVLEKIKIHTNLRNEDLEPVFNIANIDNSHINHIKELQILYQFASKLATARGKPTANEFALEYTIDFTTEQKISIKPRQKNHALHTTISELMILANCWWGQMLANSFTDAIYRVKLGKNPVHSSSTPERHQGLNVDYYTWATSPLRRSIDLINQTQIINIITKNRPLKSTDSEFANILNSFDDTYAKYIEFQNRMEMYWSLRYIEQEQIRNISATFIYKYLVQLDGLPIKINLYNHNIKPQDAGSKINLNITNINLDTQEIEVETSTF